MSDSWQFTERAERLCFAKRCIKGSLLASISLLKQLHSPNTCKIWRKRLIYKQKMTLIKIFIYAKTDTGSYRNIFISRIDTSFDFLGKNQVTKEYIYKKIKPPKPSKYIRKRQLLSFLERINQVKLPKYIYIYILESDIPYRFQRGSIYHNTCLYTQQ